ncbi:unnamed protein product [Prorocentrum cordatum]|uniref:Uncharacterized protein n=1 Tax=Prorocentrum cordatum TaxID=2364126 RepID=A0ABN9THJ7_9DINO|nr:unnamed protein product [Polarella glacialis]
MLEYLPGRLGLIQLASRGALQRHLLRPREVGDGSSCKAMGLVEARQTWWSSVSSSFGCLQSAGLLWRCDSCGVCVRQLAASVASWLGPLHLSPQALTAGW